MTVRTLCLCLNVSGDRLLLCRACADNWLGGSHEERATLLIELSSRGVACWIAQQGRMDRLPMEWLVPDQSFTCRQCDAGLTVMQHRTRALSPHGPTEEADDA